MLNVIQANCRVQFTAQDVEFILDVLRPKGRTDAEHLVALLGDEESRDLILDDEAIFRAVLERPHCLRVSTHFYFYILVRQVFRRSGLEDRSLADYVAEVLAQFSQIENTQYRLRGQPEPLEYCVDMVAALQKVDATTAFYIRTHLANQSLFLTGVFPERIRHRADRRGAPDLNYYEELGRSSYRLACHHRLAREYNLAGIFDTLSEAFPTTRRALNELGERLLSFGEGDSAIDSLLKDMMK
jgi:hypothetical protein